MKKRLLFFLILFIFSFIISMRLGDVSIEFRDIFKIFLSRLGFGEVDIEKNRSIIVYNYRLPRFILAYLCGAVLAVVGTVYQAIFKNPMADPYILGVSSGAGLGATIGIVTLGSISYMNFGFIGIFAFIGGLVTLFFIYYISNLKNGMILTTLLLTGLSLSYFFGAITSLIMVLNKKSISSVYFWISGNITNASWREVYILLPFAIIGIVYFILNAKKLNIFILTREEIVSLGVEPEKEYKKFLFVSSLMLAVTVSISGLIGFIGFMTPHIVRELFGVDNRKVLIFSSILGGIILVISDTFARTIIAPSEIPVGIITSLIGVPYFIYLIFKNQKRVI